MFKAKLRISAGDIGNVIGMDSHQYDLYGPTRWSIFDRVKELTSELKLEAKPDRIPEVQVELDKILSAFKQDIENEVTGSFYETKFDPYDDLNARISWEVGEYPKGEPIVEFVKDKTPSSVWFERGEDDPHAKRFMDVERSALALGRLTDDQLANAVFVHNHRELDVKAIMAGEPSSIGLLTAAKERIRWLSRKTNWPVNKITVMGDNEVLAEARENAGSTEFFKAVLFEMEWNCLRNGTFEDEAYVAFDVNGIIVDEKTGETESVSVHDPRCTQWAVYGRVSDSTAFALHDSDSFDEALTRAMLLAKIYQ